MAYDEKLVDRVRKLLREKNIIEKKMFGGVAFLLGRKMFCGVYKNDLIIRTGPENYEDVLTKPFVRPMDFTGKPLKGFVYVNPKGCKSSATLAKWVKLSVDYVSSLKEKKN